MSVAVLIVVAAITSCGGDSASTTLTGSPKVSTSATETAVGTPPQEVAEFRAFAAQVSDAILGHDAAFFTSRARPVQMTCKGDEQLGPCSGKAAGVLLVRHYRWHLAIRRPGDLHAR
ncbi:MAG: hypothetical protein M3O21_00075 [Chloroflexota bacterium]|nr:hypothetical protein [Chloroflexota bacterium]